jgi:hypothetical protein
MSCMTTRALAEQVFVFIVIIWVGFCIFGAAVERSYSQSPLMFKQIAFGVAIVLAPLIVLWLLLLRLFIPWIEKKSAAKP